MTSIPPPAAGGGGAVSIPIPTSLTPYLTTHTLTQNHPTNPSSAITLTFPLCIPCHTAILPKSLLEHLRKHHQLPPELRVLVKEFLASLALCNDKIGREIDFGDVKCLRNGAEVVGGLRVVGAWRCTFKGEVEVAVQEEWEGGDWVGNGNEDGNGTGEKKKEEEKEKEIECGFIRRDVTDIRRHVNLVHGVGAKGMYAACEAQSWFGGRRAVYWRVRGGSGVLDSYAGQDGDGYRGGNADVVMSEAGRNDQGQVGVEEEGNLEINRTEKVKLHEKNELREDEGEEGEGLTKRLKTPVFTSLCRWGFYGKGFGDKTPTTWRVKDGKETEIERELRLGKIC